MIKNKFFAAVLIGLVGIQLPLSFPALAQDEDSGFLLLYFKEEDLFIESSTRGRKLLSQTAENVTVVTAQDLMQANAHSLAEVLNTVPGVQVLMTGGPGSMAPASILGSDNRHVAVLVDGVPLNNLSDNIADLGTVPVQNIERVEIIKGPASSAWGSGLGGVINIITKSTDRDGPAGTLSASYGKRNTGDVRIEASGKKDRLGYYLAAGRLETDGFRQHNDFSGDNGFAKITYDITNSTRVLLSTGYDRFDRGLADFAAYDLFITNRSRAVQSTFSVSSAVNKDTDVSLAFWRVRREYDLYNYRISTGSQFSRDTYNERGYGSSAKMSWSHEGHTVVAGMDLDSGKLGSNTIAGTEQARRKYAYYLNDTITVGDLSFTPGLRRDHTDTNGQINSPSAGMTFKLSEWTLIRAYAARGFSIPPLSATFGDNLFYVSNPDLKMERVTSYQAGAETTALPSLWLKLELFRQYVTDIITSTMVSGSQFMVVNGGKARREGLEAELKSKPVYHTSFTAGAVFMTTKNALTGQTVPNTPQRTYDAGVLYDDNTSRVLLQGHYIYWNSHPQLHGKYNAMVFDLHAAHVLAAGKSGTFEAFFDIHNLFNGEQYAISDYGNPGRWSEAGVRYFF